MRMKNDFNNNGFALMAHTQSWSADGRQESRLVMIPFAKYRHLTTREWVSH